MPKKNCGGGGGDAEQSHNQRIERRVGQKTGVRIQKKKKKKAKGSLKKYTNRHEGGHKIRKVGKKLTGAQHKGTA